MTMNRTRKELEQLVDRFTNDMVNLYAQALKDIAHGIVDAKASVNIFMNAGRFEAWAGGRLYSAKRRRDLCRTLRQKGFEPKCPYDYCPNN